jgi:hypothetical protein
MKGAFVGEKNFEHQFSVLHTNQGNNLRCYNYYKGTAFIVSVLSFDLFAVAWSHEQFL